MAKHKKPPHSAATGQLVTVRTHNPRAATIKFGSVTIMGAKPSREAVKVNVARSTEALERAAKKLIRPGVDLRTKRDVPQYSVAEGETGIFVRRLNGQIERGRVVNGAFQAID